MSRALHSTQNHAAASSAPFPTPVPHQKTTVASIHPNDCLHECDEDGKMALKGKCNWQSERQRARSILITNKRLIWWGMRIQSYMMSRSSIGGTKRFWFIQYDSYMFVFPPTCDRLLASSSLGDHCAEWKWQCYGDLTGWNLRASSYKYKYIYIPCINIVATKDNGFLMQLQFPHNIATMQLNKSFGFV